MLSSIKDKLRAQAQLPLPVLLSYLKSKILTLVWRRYLASAGHGLYLSPGTKILGGSRIQLGSAFHAGAFLWLQAIPDPADPKPEFIISIGSQVDASDFVHIAATTSIVIGDGTLLGSHVHITDHGHGVYKGSFQDIPSRRPVERRLSRGAPVRIGKNCWIGDGVVVLPGVTLGDGCVVGANSVVTKSIPAETMVAGVPATPIKQYNHASGSWESIPTRPEIE